MSLTMQLNTDEARALASKLGEIAHEMDNLQKFAENKLQSTTFAGAAKNEAANVMGKFNAKIEAHRVSLLEYAKTIVKLAEATDTAESLAKSGVNSLG
ncbi:MAG TPA: hypothetical protein PKB15_00635 [Acidimicrobiia bacterium]|nr:hypothetical protein [Acidimicrobiia bacterium]